MRFIAKYAKYRASARPQRTEAYASGGTAIVQTELTAEFSIGEATAEERALARASWRFNGFYQEQDLVTIVEPDYRISAFDSLKAQVEHGWTDEERELVERELILLAGRFPQEVIRIEEKLLEPPWPNYDDFGGSRNQLLKKIVDDGFDLDEVLAYERQTQNREEIVALMEQVLEDARSEPPVGHAVEEELVG